MTDVFDELMRRGRAVSDRVHFKPGALEEGVAIVRVAFGDKSIRDIIEASSRRNTYLGSNPHPLSTLFDVGGEGQIVEILELAAYLRRLARVPRLDRVLSQMKANYEHGFLQLALAYRLEAIGIRVIQFEPDTSSGRSGDLLCAVGNRQTVIECYCPEYEQPDLDFELEHLRDELHRFRDPAVRIDIHARRMVSPKDRKALGAWLNAIDPSLQGPWRLDHESALVEVSRIPIVTVDSPGEDTLPAACGSANWIMRVSTTRDIDVRDLAITKNYSSTHRSEMRVWANPVAVAESNRDPHESLPKKLSRKLSQARSDGDAGRVVVARILGVEERDKNVQMLAKQVWDELMRKHTSWSGALLLNRRWLPTGRYRMFGVCLEGSSQSLFDHNTYSRLNAWEEQADPLRDLP